MKKTRLLEIVREEISSALNEYGFSSQSSLEEDQSSKYKQLAEKYQLDEETIMEMASLVQTKKALTKLGDEKGLELVKDVEKETLDQFRKNPIMVGDRLARKLEPEEITGKRDTRGFGADFERNFKKKAGIDFKEFTMDIEIKHNSQFPGDKPFNSGLATNTTEKDAANQIFGKTPAPKGPKPKTEPKEKAEKPESTGKKGKPAGTTKEKVATRTPGADGFDDVTYSDAGSEDKEAIQNIAGDEIAQSLSNVTGVADKFAALFKANTTEEAKKKMQALAKKANEGDQKAKAFFNNKKYSKIIKDYMSKKQVNV